MDNIIRIQQLMRDHLGRPIYADTHLPSRGIPSLFMRFESGKASHDLRINITPRSVSLVAMLHTAPSARLVSALKSEELGKIEGDDFLTAVSYNVKTRMQQRH